MIVRLFAGGMALFFYSAVALADPFIFTNPPPGEPGHADWEELGLLDITRPSTDQPGRSNGFEIIGTFDFFVTETFDVFNNILTVNGGIGSGFGGNLNSSNGLVIPSDPRELIGPGGVIPTGGGGSLQQHLHWRRLAHLNWRHRSARREFHRRAIRRRIRRA